ncbi:MAG: flagellar hook-basal body complex protein, partial [Betaproteobacteria bacterium]|nr:flagellar hook-basal body complex protein [Betaproteobacteria bacterium]
MAFQQGLSGLNTASKAIDSTSNNIANASTVGYKAGVAHFADVYANSLAGSGASQIGIGVTLAAIQQQFTQGNITTTNNPLDISINGAGFFRMDSNG